MYLSLWLCAHRYPLVFVVLPFVYPLVNTTEADPIPRVLICLMHLLIGRCWLGPNACLSCKQIVFRRVTSPGVAAADLAGRDPPDALECFGEGKFVTVANLMGHTGDPFALGEEFRRRCHPPAGYVGQRRLTDSLMEAANEGRSRHPGTLRQIGHRLGVCGVIVYRPDRRTHHRVLQCAEPSPYLGRVLLAEPGA